MPNTYDFAMLENIIASSGDATALSVAANPRFLFFKGLCYACGLGVALDYNLACKAILESARLGYLPAKYTYRRIHEALFSIEQSGEHIQAPQISPHALKEIDQDQYQALDEIERRFPNKYLAASVRMSERHHWTIKCVDLAQKELVLFTNDQLINRSRECLRLRVLEFLHEIDFDGMDLTVQSRYHDHLIALAIVLDEHGSNFFISVQAKLPVHMGYEYHLCQIEELMSPLMLACRTAQLDPVTNLAPRTRTNFESSYGTVPLHFLFMFDDQDLPNVFVLLSKDLDFSKSYHTSSSVAIIEQLSIFEGTPLSFAIQSGNMSAVDHLKTIESFRFCPQSLRELKTWGMTGLSQEDPTNLQIPPISQDMSLKLFCLALLPPRAYALFNADTQSSIFDSPINIQTFENYLLFVLKFSQLFKISYLYQQRSWIAHGRDYWPILRQRWDLITEGLDFTPAAGLDFLNTISQDLCYADSHHLLAFARFAQSRVSEENYEILAQSMHDIVTHSSLSHPTRDTRLGLVMGRQQDPDMVIEALLSTLRCSDTSAFERLLTKSYNFRIDWQETGLHSPETLYRYFAHCQSPLSDTFARILSTCKIYKAPKSWLRQVYHSMLRSNAQGCDPDLLEAAIYYSNTAGLLASLEHNLVPATDTSSQINVYHMLCTNDSYADMLSTLLDHMDNPLTQELLAERERWGGLMPIEIAYYTGSCQCLRILLGFYKANPAVFHQLACFGSSTSEVWKTFISIVEYSANLLRVNQRDYEHWIFITKLTLGANDYLVREFLFPDIAIVKDKLASAEAFL